MTTGKTVHIDPGEALLHGNESSRWPGISIVTNFALLHKLRATVAAAAKQTVLVRFRKHSADYRSARMVFMNHLDSSSCTAYDVC